MLWLAASLPAPATKFPRPKRLASVTVAAVRGACHKRRLPGPVKFKRAWPRHSPTACLPGPGDQDPATVAGAKRRAAKLWRPGQKSELQTRRKRLKQRHLDAVIVIHGSCTPDEVTDPSEIMEELLRKHAAHQGAPPQAGLGRA